MALQGHGGIGPAILKLARTLEKPLLLVKLQSGEAGSSGHWMTGVGIAVKELDHMIGRGHEGIIDMLADHDAAHGYGTGSDALGEGDHVGQHAEALGGKSVTEAAESRDDLIEDQQDAVFVAEFAKTLEIALRGSK